MTKASAALHNVLSAAILQAQLLERDETVAARDAALAFRAGLSAFELLPTAEAVKIAVDEHFVLIPRTTLPGGLVVESFWYARYPASKGADGKLVHDISAKPWVNVSFDAAGAAAGAAGLQLVRESQELAVRHLICQQPENWTSGKVGEGSVYQGLHHGTVSSAQAADYQAAENERNWHALPGGERVYGVAGNVWTWAHDDVQGDARGLVADRMKADSISLTTAPYPSKQKGMGYRTSGGESWSGDALFRGGYWHDGDDAGVFNLSYTRPSLAYVYVGFRCTKPA
jgi:hypothetical protein